MANSVRATFVGTNKMNNLRLYQWLSLGSLQLIVLNWKRSRTFKYLEYQISSRGSDDLALLMNLTKAHKCLSQISIAIATEWADPVVGGEIYKSTVWAVLLYGSKSWVWTYSILNTVCEFYHWAFWWLVDKKPRRQHNGTYKYYSADEAMEACTLRPIQVYIVRRRQTILAVVERLKKLEKETSRFQDDQDVDMGSSSTNAIRSAITEQKKKKWK